MGKTKDPLKCVKCGVGRTIRHHVIYKPEKVVRICPKCHTRITVVNTIAAVVMRKKLSNEIRLLLWEWFLIQRGILNERLVANVLGIEFEFKINHMAFIAKTKLKMKKFEQSFNSRKPRKTRCKK